MRNEEPTPLPDGEVIGELNFEPKNANEFQAMLELSSIGFDVETPEGFKKMQSCLKKHFCKP
jgi:hypothetical protein